MTMRIFRTICFFAFVLSISHLALAGNTPDIKIAVAANFVRPMDELIDIFTKRTAIKVVPIYSSTGKLYAQIKNGAPFDMFLAADTRRPKLLYKEGVAERHVVYAQGTAVLWTAMKGLCGKTSWKAVIEDKRVKKVSIADPETAPYGDAAALALKDTGLWKEVEPRLVFAQSVSQAFQFADMKGADAGFTALSYALSDRGREGCYWELPEAPPVIQGACIMRRSNHRAEVAAFLHFLVSPASKPILEKYGYK
jgi:molybdate transport system substrate-binding protein